MKIARWSVLILVMALGVAGCGNGEPERDDEGAVAEEGDVAAGSVKVGECFDDPSNREEVEAVPAVPCDQPHANEAYHAFDIDSDEFPGDEQVERLASEGCIAEFEDFVGTPYEESTLDVFFLVPSESSWDMDGDQEVLCAVHDIDREPLTGSVQGSEL